MRILKEVHTCGKLEVLAKLEGAKANDGGCSLLVYICELDSKDEVDVCLCEMKVLPMHNNSGHDGLNTRR